jgi:hypothetical protein
MSTNLPPHLPAPGRTDYWPVAPTTYELLRRLRWEHPQSYDSFPTLGPSGGGDEPTKLIQFRIAEDEGPYEEPYIPVDQAWVHNGHRNVPLTSVEVRTIDIAYGDWVKVSKDREPIKDTEKSDLHKALETLDQAIRRQRLLEQLNAEKETEVKAVRRQADVEIAKLKQQLANVEANLQEVTEANVRQQQHIERMAQHSTKVSDAIKDRDRAIKRAEALTQNLEAKDKQLLHYRTGLFNVRRALTESDYSVREALRLALGEQFSTDGAQD